MSETSRNDLPEGDRGLGDLLGAFLGGDSGAPAGGADDPLSSLLGGLMGGGAPASGNVPAGSGSATGGALDLDDMLESMGGVQGQAPAAGGSADPLGALMGGLLGGGGASAGGLGGLLGGLLGGGGGQPDTFGGGGGMMLPFAQTLSEKLGVSPATANALVGAAMGLITSSLLKQRSGDRSAEGLTMNSLMDPDYLRQSGIISQVSQETGLDEDATIRGLQEAIGLAGSQATTPPGGAEQPDADTGDLKDLLDKW